jgi:ribonuclease G
MTGMILVNAEPFETRVALYENGALTEIHIERESERSIVGNIYKGRVLRVLPGMQAAFVDIGLERSAFLYVAEISQSDSVFFHEDELDGIDQKDKRKVLNGQAQIQDLVKEGQEVLVQVLREPLSEKGAQITTYITLPAYHMVYMPETRHIGVSRKIEEERVRVNLRKLVESLRPDASCGFIIRTSSAFAKDSAIKADIDYLTKKWNSIKDKAVRSSTPSLVYQELELEFRILREYFSNDIEKIIVDNPARYEGIKNFLKQTNPEHEHVAELWQGPEPLFDRFGIELELDRVLDKRVWLKSGGFIIIDETEALTTIDVNTGKYVGRRDFEETILKTNLEAAKEVVSQLRFRNVGGIIIIDFIDMSRFKNREKVSDALKAELSKDKAKSVVVRISEIGLTEMTRKRTSRSISKKLSESCPYCEGKGYLKSRRTVAYGIFRDLTRNRAELSGKEIKLYVNPAVAELLMGGEKRLLDLLLERHQIRVKVDIKDNFHQEQYEYHQLVPDEQA